jgi:hypothetical protein
MRMPDRRRRLGATLMAIAALAACGVDRADRPPEVDPRLLLASRLTHGMGDDVLDSPLMTDSANAVILIEARSGIDTAALADALGLAGEAATRIEALVGANLLRREGPRVRTTVPIVIGADQVWYDSLAKAWAMSALDEIRTSLDPLLHEVSSRGWEPWTYHFVWSQVFDSQRLWAAIQSVGVTPSLAPAITWVVYPEHPNKTGTNLFPPRAETAWFLAVTWTPDHRTQLGVLETAADAFIDVISGRVVSDSTRRSLTALGLLGTDGRPAVPVLAPDDSLLATVRALAQRWTNTARHTIEPDRIAERLGIEPSVAWAMAYHDVSWHALAELIGLGLVAPIPAAGFSPAARGSAALVPADPQFLAVLLGSDSARSPR